MKKTKNKNNVEKLTNEKQKSSKDLYDIAKALIVYISEAEGQTKL